MAMTDSVGPHWHNAIFILRRVGETGVRGFIRGAVVLLALSSAAAGCAGGETRGKAGVSELRATLSSDCAMPYELHLSAAHVRAVRP
ncbi:hypothetical protein ADK53_12255 [Streptomyces sp. WM6373]|nr:hypothetical protein ADK53_12255 [Streptomyces sp. WM6373]